MSALPPYAQLLGLAPDGDGWVMPAHELVLGRPGFLHGGAIAGLLEITAYAALRRRLAGEGIDAVVKPITLTIDYMRGGRMVDTRAFARVERLGQRLANVEAFAWQKDREKPIAAARLNFLLDRG